jgi:hypothetical protein
MLKGIEQEVHPRRGNRQRSAASPLPGRVGLLQSQVQRALPGRQLLPRDCLQQLRLYIVMSRADVLDVPRPAMGGVDNLHRGRARRRPDCPHIRHWASLRPGLVHNFSLHQPRKPRSAARNSAHSQNVAQLGSQAAAVDNGAVGGSLLRGAGCVSVPGAR